MQVLSSTSNTNLRLGALLLMGLLFLLVWRLLVSSPGLEARGSATWVEKVFLLFLYFYISFAGLGLGRFLLMDKSFDIRTIKDLLSSLGSLIIVRTSFDISIRYFAPSLLTKLESTLSAYLFGPGDLRRSGVTHLLLSRPDASWFITNYDPRGLHGKAFRYFTEAFFQACGEPVYTDQAMELYRITGR